MKHGVLVSHGDRSHGPAGIDVGDHAARIVDASRAFAVAALIATLALAAGESITAQVVDAVEVRSFGQIDGPPGRIFDRIRSVTILDDGRLLVADGGSSQVRIYADAPDPVLAFGRPGQGPGEFTSLDWAAPYRADSIAAWDSRQGRLTIVTPTGEHGRTIAVGRGTGASLGGAPPGGPAGLLSVIGPLADGGFVARRGVTSAVPGDTTEVRRETFAYVLLGPDGSVRREIVTLPDDEQFVFAEGGSRSVRGRAFGRVTSVDVRRSAMAWASNDAFRATKLDLATGARSTLEADVESAPVRETDRRRWREENGPPADMPPQFAANLARAADAMIFPDRMPWHGGLVLADDGAIWLEHYSASGGQPVWTVLRQGAPPRSVRFPAGFRLTDVSGDLACGVGVGELDVQRVTVLRVPRG